MSNFLGTMNDDEDVSQDYTYLDRFVKGDYVFSIEDVSILQHSEDNPDYPGDDFFLASLKLEEKRTGKPEYYEGQVLSYKIEMHDKMKKTKMELNFKEIVNFLGAATPYTPEFYMEKGKREGRVQGAIEPEDFTPEELEELGFDDKVNMEGVVIRADMLDGNKSDQGKVWYNPTWIRMSE